MKIVDRLIKGGYTEQKAKELELDIRLFVEKHSISCLEDTFHYLMECLKVDLTN